MEFSEQGVSKMARRGSDGGILGGRLEVNHPQKSSVSNKNLSFFLTDIEGNKIDLNGMNNFKSEKSIPWFMGEESKSLRSKLSNSKRQNNMLKYVDLANSKMFEMHNVLLNDLKATKEEIGIIFSNIYR